MDSHLSPSSSIRFSLSSHPRPSRFHSPSHPRPSRFHSISFDYLRLGLLLSPFLGPAVATKSRRPPMEGGHDGDMALIVHGSWLEQYRLWQHLNIEGNSNGFVYSEISTTLHQPAFGILQQTKNQTNYYNQLPQMSKQTIQHQ